VAVRIRMKRMGRTHRPFYRICAIDKRSPRDGRVLEELGIYDPMVADTDARVKLNTERVDYWIGVGAQPSEKVAVLIKKYGTNGTHVEAHQAALERQSQPRTIPERGAPVAQPESGDQAAATGDQESPEAQPAAESTADAEQASGEAGSDAAADTQEKPNE